MYRLFTNRQVRLYFSTLVIFSFVVTIIFFLSVIPRNGYYQSILNFFVYFQYNNKTNFEFEYKPSRCIVPKLDPWDPSIVSFIKHPKGLRCRKVQPYMTYVDYDGFLRLNKTETKLLNDKKLSFKCYYRTFDRKNGSDDNAIEFDKEIELKEDIKLKTDNINVKCNVTSGKMFYYNVHAHPVQDDRRKFAKPSEEQLSVLVFLIDSVSYSALKRNLPLTYSYAKNVMKVKFSSGKRKKCFRDN